MNGLSVSELCGLFCCPPCPSRIAAKLAFLPPEPTYSLLPDLDSGRWKLLLSERAEFQYSQRELDGTEVFLARSSRGNKVGCMYIRCAPSARYLPAFCSLSPRRTSAGLSGGFCSDFQYGISPENIILYGQSIGTVPTVDLASRYECAAVVLHSPLTSGMRVAFPDTKKTYFFDAFPKLVSLRMFCEYERMPNHTTRPCIASLRFVYYAIYNMNTSRQTLWMFDMLYRVLRIFQRSIFLRGSVIFAIVVRAFV
uniref:Abhydrolase domain containing 17Aa n=1 Tax=Astyanax mexicanus TaxID=7994 RepID=A0A8B9GSM0_ASTMX